MTDLGSFLGTIMASAAQARRLADEESLAIAEYYNETPGLEGLSVPRLRLPEITLELPVLIEAVEDGEDETPAPAGRVQTVVLAELRQLTTGGRMTLPDSFHGHLDEELGQTLGRPLTENVNRGRRVGVRVAVTERVDEAVVRVLGRREYRRLVPGNVGLELRKKLKAVAKDSAVEVSGKSPRIRTSVLTEEVKNSGAPGNVTRVKVTLREEDLEWAQVEGPDGSDRSRLIPE